MADKDPTTTSTLVRNFMRSQGILDDLHDRRERAKEQRDGDMQKLGLRLAPTDMQEGEQIGVWANPGNSESEKCYVVKFVRGKYHVSVRGARDITK